MSTVSAAKCNKIFKIITSTSPDITLNTSDGESFKAHTSIASFLIESSAVFGNLFTFNMPESSSKYSVDIDFSGQVVVEMLRYIYFGIVENIEEVNVELFKAANVYQIENLAELCRKSMLISVKKENAFELALLADVYDLKELFEATCNIIQK